MVEQVFVKGFVNGEFPCSVGSSLFSRVEKNLALRKVSCMRTNSWSSNSCFQLWLVTIPYVGNRI
jgi:hypothetical protein